MSGGAVGRRDEIEQITGVLEAVRAGGPGHVVELTGEAGIGKSTVVAAAVAAAREAGWRVFTATPSAAESAFPWTGLAQLAAGVRRADLEGLVENHVAQIDAAISPTRAEPVSPELVAFGLAALLDTLRGNAAPALLAVDDVQWLDRPTAGALAYALRGTANRRCVALLAARSGERRPLEPARLVEPGAYTRVDLAGLSVAALREIITAATGHPFGRAELAQIHQRTGGNPLYAVELARTVLDGVPLGAAALPASLRGTIGRRVRALPPDTRRVLGAAALAANPTLARLARALADTDVVAALGPAEAAQMAGLRRAADGTDLVMFHHPLVAAAAVDALTTRDVHELHGALAAVADDAVERATHRAATGSGADEALAAELEAAAREARARGAIDTAVGFARSCVAATPADADRLTALERRYLLASVEHAAGNHPESHRAVTDLRAALADDGGAAAFTDLIERAAALEVSTITHTRGASAGVAAARQALDVVAEPHRRYLLQAQLVQATGYDDVTAGLAAAEEMFCPGAEHTGVDRAAGALLLMQIRTEAGEPFDTDAAIARAESTPADAAERLDLRRNLLLPLVWTDHPQALPCLEAVLAEVERSGDRRRYLSDLDQLVVHLIVRGDWARAEQLIHRTLEFPSEYYDILSTLASQALLLAGAGRGAEALTTLADIRARAASETLGLAARVWLACRAGQVTHTLGLPTAADDLLEAERLSAEYGVLAVRWGHFRRDLVEALLAAGRVDAAEAAAERLAADAARNRVPTARADAAAAAAVLAAARGDHAAAHAGFAAAAATQREFDLRYELARTLLTAGTAARRAGSRTEAREQLDEARSLFAAMGAALWSQRCTDELERVSGRRAKTTGAGLTATERQTAELVVAGKTNAEIAAALFVSVRTVESNLTRMYRKLGVRSRTELARRVTVGDA